IYVETLTNPLLDVGDLEGAARFAKAHDLVSLIDNTFASPLGFRPVSVGFDLVLHSATKYLNGHSDLIAGAIAGSARRIEAAKHTLDHLGGSLDPHACFLLHRGLKTLGLRWRHQTASALRIARRPQPRGAEGGGHRRWPGPALGGDRGSRGPDRRSAASATGVDGFAGYGRRPQAGACDRPAVSGSAARIQLLELLTHVVELGAQVLDLRLPAAQPRLGLAELEEETANLQHEPRSFGRGVVRCVRDFRRRGGVWSRRGRRTGDGRNRPRRRNGSGGDSRQGRAVSRGRPVLDD